MSHRHDLLDTVIILGIVADEDAIIPLYASILASLIASLYAANIVSDHLDSSSRHIEETDA